MPRDDETPAQKKAREKREREAAKKKQQQAEKTMLGTPGHKMMKALGYTLD